MNPFIFGLTFALALTQIGFYETVGMNMKVRRCARTNYTNAGGQSSGNNFFEWFLQVLGQKPNFVTPDPATSKPEACPPCKCGLTNTQRRIVGGIETKVNQYPWMAQLMYGGNFFCAAAVINDRYVLTASHCVARFNEEKMSVRIGDHDKSLTNDTETQDFGIESIIRHKNYQLYTFDNDIALIKLRGTIQFRGLMRPVCLAEKGLTFARETGIVTGWGATKEGGSSSNKLLEVRVPILSNYECRSTKYEAHRITDNMICAGYLNGGKDSCQGDSGGPMHVRNATSKIHSVVGIVSWGEGCGVKNFPGVYTRVNRYLTWIKEHTDDACYCH